MRNAIFLVVLCSGCTLGSCLAASVNVLEVEVFSHGIWRRFDLKWARGENLFKQLKMSQIFCLGKFDVELDVEIAEVMVPKRWHSLARNNLDLTCDTLA